jgi:SAM-dependent methyltransferase
MSRITSVDPRSYWEDRLARHYTAGGVGYLGLGEAYNKWMYHVRRHVFLDEVRRRIPERSSIEVLDIGSGTGFYMGLWHELGVTRLTGSDLTDVAVENLRRKYPMDRFIQFDVGETFPFASGEFGVISMMDVLFHIIDDERFEQAIANVFQALRPGGLFVFTDNFVRGDPVRIPHQASRTLTDIEIALVRIGFEIVRRRPVFFLMNAPIDSQSRLHARWWTSLTRAVSRGEWVGDLVGAALCPIELAITSRLREGPSTELMVCRRPGEEF